jgi:malate synthase
LFFFHNAATLLSKGTGPYFYLPKLENHLEARLWNDVFNFSQDELKIPRGSIRATVLIETILAAYEMDEILYELRDHSAGLNCGRWDYIFSYIKKFHARPEFVLPDRSEVTMETHFLSSYVDLLIQICHRRGIHAMGGMAAQIPIRNDKAANDQALEKVRKDKLREVKAGHDGTWVAHPGLVGVAKEVFDQYMPESNQISSHKSTGHAVSAKDLIEVPKGNITEQGLRWNIDVGMQYMHSWLGGLGCVPIYNLMEDAATAEISRAQVWQWVKYKAKLTDGKQVTSAMVKEIIHNRASELGSAKDEKLRQAARLLEDLTTKPEFAEFLTLASYDLLD